MKTFIQNLVLIITTVLLLALISYSWAEEKESKQLKSITVYSYTPPSQETRYLQKVTYEGIEDPIFKFSKDGGKTWSTHDRNPVTNEGLNGSTGSMYGDVAAGMITVLANRIEFNKNYNTDHPLGKFSPDIFSRNEAITRNVVSVLQDYDDFIDGKSENNTPENRLKFLKLTKQSVYHAGEDPYFNDRLKEIFKKLDVAKGDLSQLTEREKSILDIELEYLERDYAKWISVQKALEIYSKNLKPEEMTDSLLRLLELYEASTIDLVRQALETKARAEVAANSQKENCSEKK